MTRVPGHISLSDIRSGELHNFLEARKPKEHTELPKNFHPVRNKPPAFCFEQTLGKAQQICYNRGKGHAGLRKPAEGCAEGGCALISRSRLCFTAASALFVGFLFYLFSLSWNSSPPAEPPYLLQKGWNTLSIPAQAHPGQGAQGQLVCQLPEQIPQDSILCFFSGKQRGSLWIGEQRVLTWGSQTYPASAGSQYIFVPLTSQDGGRPVYIDFTVNHSSFPNRAPNVWLGPVQLVLREIWRASFGGLVLSLLVFLIGVLSIVLSFYYHQSAKGAISIRFSGAFLFLLSLWGISQTGLPGLFSSGPWFLILLESIPLLGMPICIVLAFRPLTGSFAFQQEYDSFFVLFTLYFLFALGADCLGLACLPDLSVWGILFFAIFVVYVGVFGFLDFQAGAAFSKPQRILHSSLLLDATVCIILAVCFAAFFGTVRFQNLFLGIGYAVSAAITFLLFYEMRTLLQIQEDLTQSRITLLLSQIKPHFLYNTLNSIRTLIRTDAEAADVLVYNFSRFLRSNMLSISNQDLIPFAKELDHIQSYVRIEETCFPKLKVHFDIQAHNFNVPPLTIQPLVENAIKHGVLKQARGGTVFLRSYETRLGYCVEIEDDGVGFLVEQVGNGAGGHGLDNVKSRLEYQCGAQLSIASAPGEGCKALVVFPKKREKEDL